MSPQIAHAAARLLTPGPPQLRNSERWGSSIALHILQEKSSLMDWVVQLNLTGHNNREARTIARAVELGVSEYEAGYLASKAAEVQLQRLLAVMVAAQSGSTAEAGCFAARGPPRRWHRRQPAGGRAEEPPREPQAREPAGGAARREDARQEEVSRSREIFPLPRLSGASVCRFKSRRIQKRLASLRKTLGLANAAIDALNELHGTRTCRTVAGPADVKSQRVAEVLQSIMECSQ